MCVCDLSVRECECVFIACRASECECALLLCFVVVCVYWHTCLTATPLCVFLLAFAFLLHTCLTAGPCAKKKEERRRRRERKKSSGRKGRERASKTRRTLRAQHRAPQPMRRVRTPCGNQEPAPAAQKWKIARTPKAGSSHHGASSAPASSGK